MRNPYNRFTPKSFGYNHETVPTEVLEELIGLAFLFATSAYTKQIIPAPNADPCIAHALETLQFAAVDFLNTAEVIKFDAKRVN